MSANTGIAPMTPEQKLANQRWRQTNSLWIFIPLLSFGLLGWLGFLIAALRTGEQRYWRFFGVYAAVCVVFLVMISAFPEGPASGLATIPMLAAWIAPAVHAAALNRSYLTTLAHKGEWYAPPSTNLGLAQPHPQPYPVAPAPLAVGVPTGVPAGAAPQPGRALLDAERLERDLRDLEHRMKAGRHRLPDAAVVVLYDIFGALRDALERAPQLVSSPHDLHVVNRMIRDYVPTSLDTYLNLPPEYATTPGPHGRTAQDEFTEQLQLLRSESRRIAQAVHTGDIQSLRNQGRFLQERFGTSPLDI